MASLARPHRLPAMDGSAQPAAAAPEPRRRHRAVVWTLVVLASILLILSITANWVQEAFLDTNQVSKTTDSILADQDVQEQLSVFAVDQLYANVDVQGQIEKQLPSKVKPFAGPITAATRDLANTVAEKALASPQVQGLVSAAVTAAHKQFVSLIEDKGQFVSTTNGQVTFQYGAVIADLAGRLGLNPATIQQVQTFIQDFSVTLKDRLTQAQSKIESARAGIAQAQAGSLDPRDPDQSHGAQYARRRPRHPDQGPGEEDLRRRGQGALAATGQALRPDRRPHRPQATAGQDRAPHRGRAQGSEPGQRPKARRQPGDARRPG